MNAAVLVFALLSSAPPPRLHVVRGPGTESCAAAGELDARVSARMGAAAFSADGQRTVDVTLSRTADAWVATVEMVDADGTPLGRRDLRSTAATCAGLRDALVITLAVALDQLGRMPPVEKPSSAPASQPAEAPASAPRVVAPPPVPAPVPAPAATAVSRRQKARPRPWPRAPASVSALPARARPWGIEVSSGVTATAGWLPAVTPAAGMGAAFRLDRFSVGAEMLGLGPSLRNAGGRAWWGGGAVITGRACVTAWWLGGCALTSGGGLLHGVTGEGRTGPLPTPALSAGGRWYVDLPLLRGKALRLSVDVLAPLLWTRVVLDGSRAWETPRFTGSAGAWWRFSW